MILCRLFELASSPLIHGITGQTQCSFRKHFRNLLRITNIVSKTCFKFIAFIQVK